MNLQETYLDWFFLRNFGKGQEYWTKLTDEKIECIMALENEKQKEYWENWKKLIKMFGR
jgi:hypothetical protein